MLSEMTVQYLHVPEVGVKAKRSGSLPGPKLRNILALKAQNSQGLRLNKSHGDLGQLQFSPQQDTHSARHEGLSPSPSLSLRNQSRSSSHLADDYNNGNQLNHSSPIITLTTPNAKAARYSKIDPSINTTTSTTKMMSSVTQKNHTKDKLLRSHRRNSSLPDGFFSSFIGKKASTATTLCTDSTHTPSASSHAAPSTHTTATYSTNGSDKTRSSAMRQHQHSPIVPRRSLGGDASVPDSLAKLKQVHTTEGAISGYYQDSLHGTPNREGTIDDDENGESNGHEAGSGGSDNTDGDVVDGSLALDFDPQRKAAMKQLQEKIRATEKLIQEEQRAKEENVNEYLGLSQNADKAQKARIKTLFEKRNVKSTQTIKQHQIKVDNYRKRLREVDLFGVTGPRKAKEVMKDMGQGLKVLFGGREMRSRDVSPQRPRAGLPPPLVSCYQGCLSTPKDNYKNATIPYIPPQSLQHRDLKKDVGGHIRDGLTGFSGGVVDNIRGAKESIVSKPKEFVHLVKNRFGSADNINNIKNLEDSQGSTTDDPVPETSRAGQRGGLDASMGSCAGGGVSGSTLPSGYQLASSSHATRESEEGEEVISTVSSESRRSAGVHSAGVHSHAHSAPAPPPVPHSSTHSGHGGTAADSEPRYDHTILLNEISRLADEMARLRIDCELERDAVRQMTEEQGYRNERMEEQINDLTELHQHEVSNIKQELQSMEEKMEYQLEERTRDMQELLETCQTRITKMELQQQQQQLISMEGFDSSNFRNLITKLINVVLAILAVLLVLVATTAQFLGPFLTTRVRIITTLLLITSIVLVWQNWTHCTDIASHIRDSWTNLIFR